MKIPCDFQKDFLKNSHNKNELYKYLARRFFDISTAESSCDQSFESSQSSIDQIFVVTHGDSILTENDIDTDGIFYYTSEEADARVIGHVLNISVNNDYKKIFVQTSDTDVFILLLAYFPSIRENCTSAIYCKYGLGSNTKHYHINALADEVGYDICRALPFFYAFSGCDTVSNLFKHTKVAMWDAWRTYPSHENLTLVFQQLSDEPSEISSSQMDEIEEFVKYVYY